MAVIPTEFHSYGIITSQVISFPRSIITFSGKKAVNTERGRRMGFNHREIFLTFLLSVLCAMHAPLIILRELIISSWKGIFLKCKRLSVQSPELAQIMEPDACCQYLS